MRMSRPEWAAFVRLGPRNMPDRGIFTCEAKNRAKGRSGVRSLLNPVSHQSFHSNIETAWLPRLDPKGQPSPSP